MESAVRFFPPAFWIVLGLVTLPHQSDSGGLPGPSSVLRQIPPADQNRLCTMCMFEERGRRLAREYEPSKTPWENGPPRDRVCTDPLCVNRESVRAAAAEIDPGLYTDSPYRNNGRMNRHHSRVGKDNMTGRVETATEVDSIVEAWVRQYGADLVASRDIAVAAAVDGSGNLYVTGSVSTQGYVTVKYDPTGREEWVAWYIGPGEGSDADIPASIAVDQAGNVFVSGSSVHSPGSSETDYATIKYNPSGGEEWVARYHGPDNGYAVVTAIAVDHSGNVFVTGWHNSYETGSRGYVTVKYNTEGSEEWVASFYEAEDSFAEATAIAVDNEGHAFVTGWSWSEDGLFGATDGVTLKYGATGLEEWVARYDGGGVAWDIPVAIALDMSGNVYVTGSSSAEAPSTEDYATIKYNPSGEEEWVARYNGPANHFDAPSGIAVEQSGEVYVTGVSYKSDTASEFCTVKYSSSGTMLWEARYSGLVESWQHPRGIALDQAGDVYVTGAGSSSEGIWTDCVTVKYDASGGEQWVVRYNDPDSDSDRPVDISTDASGHVVVAGTSQMSGTSSDYNIIRYTASGEEEWVSRYDGPPTSSCWATDLAVGASGDVYVTGGSWGSTTSGDFATVKYNSSGGEEWIVRYNGPTNGFDSPVGIVVDESGNAYVTGFSLDPESPVGTQYDYVTAKYTATGVEEWLARYDGPGGEYDVPAAITMDESGNVYVTGASKGELWMEIATIKYTPSGTAEWVARFDGAEPGDDYPTGIAVDALGNVYVTGVGYRQDTGEDYVTIKYDPSGVEEWAAWHNGGSSDGWDAPVAIAVDDSGNVWVTGSGIGDDYAVGYSTIRYDSSGTQKWVAVYTGPDYGGDFAAALAVDRAGNAYVTGSTPYAYARTTVKYNSSGNVEWVSREDGESADIILDEAGNVYVTGTAYEDYFTSKYTSSGTEEWVAYFNGSLTSVDIVAGMAIDAAGGIYLTGSSIVGGNTLFSTVKYEHGVVSAASEESAPWQFVLEQNYPNPFNPSTTIMFSIPGSGELSLKVFNLLGEEVATLVSGHRESGTHTVRWDATGQPSGVYFYRLRMGEYVETRRLVLVR